MRKNKPTIQDIATHISVTPSTVSRALNNHPAISEATRQLVLETAKQMNYRPNYIASALRSGKSYVIGVIVPQADRTFFASIIRGIESEVAADGYGVILCQTNDDPVQERRALDILMRSQVDGIIASVTNSKSNRTTYARLKEERVPIVFYDRIIESVDVSSVVINDFRGGYIATTHLISNGYKRIAHLCANQNLNIYRERSRGFRAAMLEANLPVREDWLLPSPSKVEAGFEAAKQLFKDMSDCPDAIFSSSDYAALGAIQYLKSKNISVPETVGIVGFANEPFTSYVEPALSTIEQHSLQIGRAAARTFLEEIQQPTSTISKQVMLQPQLIVRASSTRKKSI